MDTLAARLKYVREQVLGVSQAVMAARLAADGGLDGTTNVSVMRYEKGERMPGADYVSAVAKVAGVGVGWLLTGRTETEGGQAGHAVADDAQGVRDEIHSASKPDAETVPSFEQMEWIPRLFERIIALPGMTASDKVRLMAEVNAAGMRYWAVSAEWAAGQRGMAMQDAEKAGGERAKASRVEAASARARARTLGPDEKRFEVDVEPMTEAKAATLRDRRAAESEAAATPREGQTPKQKEEAG